jgi:hypothetical protein
VAKRNNKTWAPSWREDREKGVRAVQHNFTRMVNAAQRGGSAWNVEQAAAELAEVRAALEEAEATLERYKEAA